MIVDVLMAVRGMSMAVGMSTRVIVLMWVGMI